MSRDVERIDRVTLASKSAAAHARAADLVERGRKLNTSLAAYFEEIEEVKRLMREERSLWDGPAFELLVEAAFETWRSRGARETRVELDRVGPVPMMELEGPYPDSPA